MFSAKSKHNKLRWVWHHLYEHGLDECSMQSLRPLNQCRCGATSMNMV
jgi:hypothetical protein